MFKTIVLLGPGSSWGNLFGLFEFDPRPAGGNIPASPTRFGPKKKQGEIQDLKNISWGCTSFLEILWQRKVFFGGGGILGTEEMY